MIVCGIDPGTQCTGYGILDLKGDKAIYIAHGTIKPKSGDMHERLKYIYLALTDLFKLYMPQEAAIETSFYALNAQTALKLGQVRGVIMLAMSLSDIPIFEYTPTEVKKATCGYGHADKGQINAMMHTLLKIPKGTVSSPDASDALAIGFCHSTSRRLRRLVG